MRIAALTLSLVLGFAAVGHAGDVKMRTSRTGLKLTGDDAGAVLTIDATGPDSFHITPGPGTTLDGQAVDVTTTFFQGANLSVSLGDGENELTLSNLHVSGNVTLKGGKAFNHFVVQGTFLTGKLAISGKGQTAVSCSTSSALEGIDLRSRLGADVSFQCHAEDDTDVKITTGSGEDEIDIRSNSDARNLTINTGSGDDSVSLGGGSFEGAVKVSLGSGNNSAEIADIAVHRSLTVTSGSGNDTVQFDGSFVDEGVKVNVGGGVNSVQSAFTLSDFESLSIAAGGQNDTFYLSMLQIDEDLKVSAGGGDNVITVLQTDVGDDLTVTAGGGDDVFTIGGLLIGGDFKFNLGGGMNTQP